jgi:predicted phosphodiesterase
MLAVLSDIHANYPALDAVIRDAKARGAVKFLCLGDVIGYNGQPEECVQRARSEGFINILGNHDSYITTGQNCDRSKVVAQIIDKHREELSLASVSWLKASVSFLRQGRTLFLHGGPNDYLDEYLYEVGKDTFPTGVTRLFAGHTHVQVRHDFHEKTFVNPGSVGQPRDGDSRAAYALVDDDCIEFHRVEYDVQLTVSVMREKGYEDFMWSGLFSGSQINGKVSEILRR